MAEGRQRENWQHTSWILAKLHNVNVVKKSDLVNPSFFDPFAPKEKPELVPLESFKSMFKCQSPSK